MAMTWRERLERWAIRESAELVLEITRWALALAVAMVVNIDAVGNAAMHWAQRNSTLKVKSFRPERLRLTKGGKLIIVRQ